MSDNPTSPHSDPSPKPSDSPTSAGKKPKAKRKGWAKWRHRLAVFAGVILAIIVIVRAAMPFWFPSVLRKVAARYGMNVRYERQEFHLLGGDCALWHIQLIPFTSHEAVFESDYIRGNISTLNLLRGKLDAWRVEADGVQMVLDRTADGRIPLLDQIVKNLPKKTATPAAASPVSGPPKALDLSAPLQIDAFRLSQIDLVLRDKSVSPPFETHVTMNFRLSDLQSPTRPTKFSLEIWAEHLLDSLRISGMAMNDAQKLDADMDCHVYGLQPRTVAPYLAALGIRPIGKTINFGARATVHVAATQPAGSAEMAIKLNDVHADSDGVEAAHCDLVSVLAPVVSSAEAHVTSINVENVHLAAGRSSNGLMRFLGLEFFTPPASATRPAQTVAAASPGPTTRPAGYQLTVDRLNCKNISAAFEDAATSPPAKLAMIVDDLTISPIAMDSRQAQQPTNFKMTMHAPGLANAISLDGSARLGTVIKSAHAALSAKGIALSAAEPYLTKLGVQSTLANGSLTASLDASWSTMHDKTTATIALRDIQLSDGDKSLLAMSDAQIAGLSRDNATGAISVNQISLTGPALIARREADGAMNFLGLKVRPGEPPTQAGPPPAVAALQSQNHQSPNTAVVQSAAKSTSAPLPPIAIQLFQWKDIKLQFIDQMVSPPQTFEIGNARVEAHNLSIDMASDKAGPPAEISASIDAPGLIGRAQLNAALHAIPHGLAIDSAEASAEGLNLAKLAPYLQATGIQPTISDGQFQVKLAGSIKQESSGPVASMDVSSLKLTDGNRQLAALGSLHADALTLGTPLAAKAIHVDRPHLFVEREADGALDVAGVRLVKHTRPPNAKPIQLPMPLAIDDLKVTDATLDWADHADGRSVKLQAIASTSFEPLQISPNAEASNFSATLRVLGAVDQVSVSGPVILRPKTVAAELVVKVNGMHGGIVAAYVPPTLAVDLHNGQFAAKVNATAQIAQAGGLQLVLRVDDVDWRDTDSLLALKNLTVDVPRYDPAGGVIAVNRLSTAGLFMRVKRLKSGEMSLLGIATKTPRAAPAKPAAAKGSSQSNTPIVVSTQPTSENVNAIVAAARKPLPLMTLKTLDLAIDRIEFVDESRPAAAPIVLRDFHFTNGDPVVLGGPEQFARDPVALKIAGAIDPIVGKFTIDGKLAPFAREPSAKIDLLVANINGKGLLRAAPELADRIDGSPLSHGQFTTHLEATAHVQRRTPADFDFTHGFDLDVLLNNCSYRATPDGPVLLGLDQIESDGVHINTSQSTVIAKTIEIHTPRAQAMLDKSGLHVLGLTIKMEAALPTTGPATKTVVAVKSSEKLESTAAASKQPTPAGPPPPGVIRADKILISGCDIRFEDRRGTPPMVVPLNDLDAEVRGLSNQCLYTDKPIDFSVLIGADKAPLATRIGNKLDIEHLENRDWLAQVAMDGHVSLYPQMHGWAKLAINGFDLISAEGPASLSGVNIDGGTYDGTVDLRFVEGNKIIVRSKHVFTDLAMTEGSNGPVQKTLKLPSPLNIVIATLTDANGAITVPANFTIENGKTEGIGGAVGGAIVSVLAKAAVSEPLKAVKGVTSLAGIKWFKKKPMSPITFTFGADYTALTPQEMAALDPAIKELQKKGSLTLRHELSAADLTLAQQRANPSHDDAVNMAYQLREHKLELMRKRQEMAGQTSGALAILTAEQSSQAVAKLQEVDREIAQTENALDQVYDLLRPGADKQAARRTRAAALSIGRERLDAVKQAILTAAAEIPGAAERVHVTNPSYTPVENIEHGQVTISPATVKQSQPTTKEAAPPPSPQVATK